MVRILVAVLSVASVLNACYAFLPVTSLGTSVFGGSTLAQPTCSVANAQSQLSMAAEGKVLVSGFLSSKERTDQFVFDVLHAQGAWTKIVAFSHQTSFAKKRLISRTSRYSGLLDILEFDEGDRYDTALMQEKLKGCDAWLCFDCDSDKIKEQLDVAKAAGIKTLVLTSTMSAADAKTAGVQEAFEAAGINFTFIRTGEIKEGKEGGAIMTCDLLEDLPSEEVLREDIVRAAAEVFRVEGAVNKAFAFGKGNEYSAEYLKGLREKGVDRVTELSNLITGGMKEYVDAKAKEAAEKEAKERGEILTDEEKAEKKRIFDAERKKEMEEMMANSARKMAEYEAERIEKEATLLLKREWESMYWKRNSVSSEEDYRKENWERAMAKAKKVIASQDKHKRLFRKEGDEQEMFDGEEDDGEPETHWQPEAPNTDDEQPEEEAEAVKAGAKGSDDAPATEAKKDA